MLRIFNALINIYTVFYISIFFTDYSFILKKGISNISGMTVGLAILFAARYIYNKKNFPDIAVIKLASKIGREPDKKIVLFLIAVLFLSLCSVSIYRHASFSSAAYDLGIFDQVAWNTARGDVLFSSLKGNFNILGDHFEPVLLLVSPLYLIWPNAIALLIIQSLFLALAIIPLYLICRYYIKGRTIIFAFLVSYALSRPLRGIAFSDFHPECFILFFLFWAYYFLISRKNVLLWLSIVMLICCKEDTAFLVSTLGIFAFFFQKRRLQGILLFLGGILAWIIITKFVIPHFNPLGRYDYMNRLAFGQTYADNFKFILNHPFLALGFLLKPEKVIYVIKILAPVLFLSFLSAGHFILFFVPLFKNLIAPDNFSGFYQISSHYTAALIPFVYASAVYGASLLLKRVKRFKLSTILSMLLVFISLMFYGKTDAYKQSRFLNTVIRDNTMEKLGYLKLIPDNASVAAVSNLVPHISHRKYIYEWGPCQNSKASYLAEYVLIDMDYVSGTDKPFLEDYLSAIKAKGYLNVFQAREGSFLIFRNMNYDHKLIEGLSIS